MIQKVIYIHEAYNLSLKDHKVIHEKENLSNIEKMLHMLKESILVEDFNLHHFTWRESFYSIVIVIVIHRLLWHWFRLDSWRTLCYLYRVNKTLWERKSLVVYTTASRSWNNEIDTVLLSNESIASIQRMMLE